MVKVGILGATGYAGIELVRLLSQHPEAQIVRAVSQSYIGKKISDVYPSLRGIVDIECCGLDVDDIAASCDVAFTALPHGASKEVIPKLYDRGVRVIDFSGDFRYNNPKVYEQWYGEPHSAPELLSKSVYGLCELHRSEIGAAKIIGNPGCYTTCSILGLYPLLKHRMVEVDSIIIDAKSGVTGAGRSAVTDNLFCEVNEGVRAYKIATHRHTSEIEQELSIAAGEPVVLTFTPHLIPMERGIYATGYAKLKLSTTAEELTALYAKFYADEKFVRILPAGTAPRSSYVNGSNYVDIGISVDKRTDRVIVVSAIDNLIKGAAGQALQNFNILFGFPEDTALSMPGYYI